MQRDPLARCPPSLQASRAESRKFGDCPAGRQLGHPFAGRAVHRLRNVVNKRAIAAPPTGPMPSSSTSVAEMMATRAVSEEVARIAVVPVHAVRDAFAPTTRDVAALPARDRIGGNIHAIAESCASSHDVVGRRTSDQGDLSSRGQSWCGDGFDEVATIVRVDGRGIDTRPQWPCWQRQLTSRQKVSLNVGDPSSGDSSAGLNQASSMSNLPGSSSFDIVRSRALCRD